MSAYGFAVLLWVTALLKPGDCGIINITAEAGTSAVLPCQFAPWYAKDTIEVAKWFYSGPDGATTMVLKSERGHASESGRLAFRGQLSRGDGSLHVDHLKRQDEGIYRCHLKIKSTKHPSRRLVFLSNLELIVTPGESASCMLVLLVPIAMLVCGTVALIVWRYGVNRGGERRAEGRRRKDMATKPPRVMNNDVGIYEAIIM